MAHTAELQYPGITDAAGNPLDDTVPPPGLATKDFVINFDVQPEPVYITTMALESGYEGDGSTVIGTQQSYFEVPPSSGPNTWDNTPAPPTAIVIDFSNPLPFDTSINTPINYAQDVQLIASANSAGRHLGRRFRQPGPRGPGKHRIGVHHPHEHHGHPL